MKHHRLLLTQSKCPKIHIFGVTSVLLIKFSLTSTSTYKTQPPYKLYKFIIFVFVAGIISIIVSSEHYLPRKSFLAHVFCCKLWTWKYMYIWKDMKTYIFFHHPNILFWLDVGLMFVLFFKAPTMFILLVLSLYIRSGSLWQKQKHKTVKILNRILLYFYVDHSVCEVYTWTAWSTLNYLILKNIMLVHACKIINFLLKNIR